MSVLTSDWPYETGMLGSGHAFWIEAKLDMAHSHIPGSSGMADSLTSSESSSTDQASVLVLGLETFKFLKRPKCYGTGPWRRPVVKPTM